MMILFACVSLLFQSGSIVKNNGEVIQLRDIKICQVKGVAVDVLRFEKHKQAKEIEISRLKRMNLKEPLGRSKGVTRWLAILVEKNNQKHEVVIDLVELKGVTSAGEEEVISMNSINKITF